jgi:TonB-linked SusC/RagA family outer membrane protein
MNEKYNMKKRRVNRFSLLMILLLAVDISIFAGTVENNPQGKTIQGIVLDINGLPLIGVNVQEKGTTNGNITDSDGRFTLKMTQENATLIFSYIGYLTQEIQVDDRSVWEITMQENISILDEVVVVGYGTKRKGGISAAVTTIGNKDIMRTTSTTTSGAIVGKMAGITARQKSGVPGSGANLQIRNLGTPLYVIDGIMTDENAFNNLDINDIDNISVLKDGSAAIYGVKAANGVILITTKTGKKGQKPQVNIHAYTGWQQWTKYPELMNAYQWNYANYMKDINDGKLNQINVDMAKNELEKWKTGYYNPETGEDYRGYNWKEAYVSDRAPQNYIHTNVSGGSDKTAYYLSLSHVDQDAVLKDYNFNRTNLQANFDIQLSDYFKIRYQMFGKIEKNSSPGLPGDNDYELIRTSLFGLQPVHRPFINDNPLYLNYIIANDSRNIAAFTRDIAGNYDSNRSSAQNLFEFEYKTPLKGLSTKGIFAYDYADYNAINHEKTWNEYSQNENTGELTLHEKQDSYLVNTKENIKSVSGQFLLNYDQTFAQKHHLSGTAGFEFYERQNNYTNITQTPVENPFIDLLSTSENNTINQTRQTISTASFIFRAGYDYAQKYILDISGRYDGSWKFPKGKRWGFFPSISGAWRLSEEAFFRESYVHSWWSNFKIRASYGEMGDDNLGELYSDFAFLSGYTYKQGSANIPIDPLIDPANKMVMGFGLKETPNTGITWMTVSLLDIGIDLGFFNNKLIAEFDVFRRKREGIAAQPDDILFPLESGLKALPQNLNSDENTGIDGYIKWTDKINDFNYFLGLNATLARQKNGKRYGELFLNDLDRYFWSQSNRWANVSNGQVWQWESIGVFQTQEEIDNYPVNIDGNNNTSLLPGDVIFKDINADGVINNMDKRPLGYASIDWPWDSSKGNKNPILSLGFNFGLEWKGIDFAADFAGGFMNTFVPDWFVKWGTNRTVNGYVYNSLNVWRHEDIFDPTSPWIPGDFPAVRANNPSTRNENNFYTREINYLRLRNLVVGYTLPDKWTQKAYIQKCRFYAEGSNLLCWDSMGKMGFDPEISTTNGTDYPQHRVYTIGINITFK